MIFVTDPIEVQPYMFSILLASRVSSLWGTQCMCYPMHVCDWISTQSKLALLCMITID